LILFLLKNIFHLMTDSLFFGFDGGATKTTGVAINASRDVVAEATGGPSNFQIIGTEKASENIVTTAEIILNKAGADFSRIKTVYLGLTGAGRIGDADRMRDAFISYLEKRHYPVPVVKIGSDAIAALEGAFSGRPGMILISGTGSILFAKDDEERIHRVGGWGRLIGDEGSGYAIGRACLAAVSKEMDGRGSPTSMSSLLKERKLIENQRTMIAAVYQDNLDIASLAPIVIEAAEGGDEAALQILANAARELTAHVRAALPKLNLPVSLALVGSVISTDNSLSRNVKQLIRTEFPQIIIQKADHPPALGAALLALKIEGPE
jgi:N-acetylglucosamine kinase-like BadF-type ATPase